MVPPFLNTKQWLKGYSIAIVVGHISKMIIILLLVVIIVLLALLVVVLLIVAVVILFVVVVLRVVLVYTRSALVVIALFVLDTDSIETVIQCSRFSPVVHTQLSKHLDA